MPDRPLGRLEPTDWTHVERHGLALAPAAAPVYPTPVVLGINWYSAFDQPIQSSTGRWWVAHPGQTDLGSVRGGHAICVKPTPTVDLTTWWTFYDQGAEGTCVGFSLSRMMTLLNRRRYVGTWLYDRATEIDEWPGNEGDRSSGTSVRAGCEVLRTVGPERFLHDVPTAEDGIAAYRWAVSVDEVHQVLASPLADQLGAVPLVNSWGRYAYPHYAWLPDDVLARLLGEYGEAAIPTDR